MSRLIADAASALTPATCNLLAPASGAITCGDVAISVTLLRFDGGRALALCADDEGSSETVEIDLVAPVAPGDRLLVDADSAIARLFEEVPE